MAKTFASETHNPQLFWLGTLKHKDLAGHEISSQAMPCISDDEDNPDISDDDPQVRSMSIDLRVLK